jgi:hypothetical protein
VWPPIGSVVQYAAGAASVLILLIGKLPRLPDSKISTVNWFKWGLLTAVLGLVGYAYCLITYVKEVETPKDGIQYRAVGSERTAAAANCPPQSSDQDLLKCAGLEDADIEKVWSPGSVRRARLELFLSYIVFLGSINLMIEAWSEQK